MSKSFRYLSGLFLLMVAGIGSEEIHVAHASAPDQCDQEADQEKTEGEKRLSKFMREKLTSSQQVLEGLMVEDYDLMQKGAQRMIEMSNATEWQVIEGPIFARQSDEFRSTAKEVIKFAKEKNLDGASLSYLHLTMTCIACHKKVNKVMISQR
ncbi:hypothetical protein [Gimesia sp.]|uniref:hypothetical protein n=1 Tax=Gimesia sp. TaxID=2024833 RepID=UPI000C628DD8|nr:hypothetical protein [Gimesia sp.]MAX36355.1 hypothetical protein [Gimesia sp.]HAH45635.1 hypothetical protein [Planctomycetaceae bacterium]HBL42894.1 hypothetical protein [Planctomycetaceae bacterium]|tara:strand:+ start:1641 stop:2099 length:459 start_codon:yes stop_codon:yes gene_type:complete